MIILFVTFFRSIFYRYAANETGYKTLEVRMQGSTVNQIIRNSGLMFVSLSTCVNVGEWEDHDGTCSPCPPGGVCPGGGRVWPRPGYWSKNENTAPFPCRWFDACIGVTNDGGTVATSNWLDQNTSDLVAPPSTAPIDTTACRRGYTGSFCDACENNFSQWTTGKCIFCGQTAADELYLQLLVIIAVLVFLLLATSVAFMSPSRLAQFVATFISLQQFVTVGRTASSQLDGGFGGAVKNVFQVLTIVNFEVEMTKPGCAFPKLDFAGLYGATFFIILCGAFLFAFAAFVRSRMVVHTLKNAFDELLNSHPRRILRVAKLSKATHKLARAEAAAEVEARNRCVVGDDDVVSAVSSDGGGDGDSVKAAASLAVALQQNANEDAPPPPPPPPPQPPSSPPLLSAPVAKRRPEDHNVDWRRIGLSESDDSDADVASDSSMNISTNNSRRSRQVHRLPSVPRKGDAVTIGVKPDGDGDRANDGGGGDDDLNGDDDLDEVDYASDDEVERLFEFFNDEEKDDTSDDDDDGAVAKTSRKAADDKAARADAVDSEYYLLLTNRLRRHYYKQLQAENLATNIGVADDAGDESRKARRHKHTHSSMGHSRGHVSHVPPLFAKIDILRARMGVKVVQTANITVAAAMRRRLKAETRRASLKQAAESAPAVVQPPSFKAPFSRTSFSRRSIDVMTRSMVVIDQFISNVNKKKRRMHLGILGDRIVLARKYFRFTPTQMFLFRLQHSMLILAVLTYLRVATLAFQSLYCIEVDSPDGAQWRLETELSTVCWTGPHRRYARVICLINFLFATLFTTSRTLMAPFFVLFLKRARNLLRSKHCGTPWNHYSRRRSLHVYGAAAFHCCNAAAATVAIERKLFSAII
jgi:hypothetical protein